MGTLITVVFVVLAVGTWWAVTQHNRLVVLENLVTQSWRQVDVELRRRYDLIPNLVRVVEAYAQYERATILALTAARDGAMRAAETGVQVRGWAQRVTPERVAAEDGVGRVCRSALVQAEAYPDLRASAQFVALSAQLAETEDRIAASRRLYNGNVRVFNTAIAAAPGSIVAGAMGLRPALYFEPGR